MIQRHDHPEEGYNPLVISDGWQVARLNYLPTHGLDDIDNLEVHRATDEVFILFEGRAVLLWGEVGGDEIDLSAVEMEPCVIYNVPAGVWHNIAMARDAKCVIVERDNTHKVDVSYVPLSAAQKRAACELIAETLG